MKLTHAAARELGTMTLWDLALAPLHAPYDAEAHTDARVAIFELVRRASANDKRDAVEIERRKAG